MCRRAQEAQRRLGADVRRQMRGAQYARTHGEAAPVRDEHCECAVGLSARVYRLQLAHSVLLVLAGRSRILGQAQREKDILRGSR
jgi:hypothetical protein